MEQHKFTEIQSSDHQQDSLYSKQCWENYLHVFKIEMTLWFLNLKKNYCEWTKDLNGRSEALIFLDGKARQTLQDIIISSWMRLQLLRQWLQPLTEHGSCCLPALAICPAASPHCTCCKELIGCPGFLLHSLCQKHLRMDTLFCPVWLKHLLLWKPTY